MKKWVLSLWMCIGLPLTWGDLVIDMTPIGNPGNSPDVHWWGSPGSVSYDYQISTYEVTVAQYTEFLNAVAASDPYGLYNGEIMGADVLGASILRSGEDGSYTYSAVEGKENQPVRGVSFYDSCRFCNWLANGQGSGSTETGSYTLSDGYTLLRTATATWVLPTEDEWYKAAYYDPETDTYSTYPNGLDDAPSEPTDGTTTREMNFGDDPYWNPDGGTREYYTEIGETTGRSFYGVADMGGNVAEWTETFQPSNYRIVRGGGLMYSASDLSVTGQQPADPGSEDDLFGFRVAYIIPEPSTVFLCFTGLAALFLSWVKRHRG